jgi:hypothetical protein
VQRRVDALPISGMNRLTTMRRFLCLRSALTAGVHGKLLARRIRNAWIVVEGGERLQQRLTVLQHLNATIHA